MLVFINSFYLLDLSIFSFMIYRLRLSSKSSKSKSSSSESSSNKSPPRRGVTTGNDDVTPVAKSNGDATNTRSHHRLFSRSVNPVFAHNHGDESPPPAYRSREDLHQSVEDLTRMNYKVNLATLKSTVQRNQSQRKVGLQRAKSKLSDYASAHQAVRELQS